MWDAAEVDLRIVAGHARVGFTYYVQWSKCLPLEANSTTGKRQANTVQWQ